VDDDDGVLDFLIFTPGILTLAIWEDEDEVEDEQWKGKSFDE
jgi:hypothetical protein